MAFPEAQLYDDFDVDYSADSDKECKECPVVKARLQVVKTSVEAVQGQVNACVEAVRVTNREAIQTNQTVWNVSQENQRLRHRITELEAAIAAMHAELDKQHAMLMEIRPLVTESPATNRTRVWQIKLPKSIQTPSIRLRQFRLLQLHLRLLQLHLRSHLQPPTRTTPTLMTLTGTTTDLPCTQKGKQWT